MHPSILYYGHGSLRFVSKKKLTVYVDPFYPGDYSMPADFILLTHDNQKELNLSLVEKKENCTVVTVKDAFNDGNFNIFGYKGVTVSAYESYFGGVRVENQVAYLVTFDDLKFYCAGKSERTPAVKLMTDYGINFGFYPIDKAYGLDAKEAVALADLMNVKCAIPVYNDPEVVNTLAPSDKNLDEFEFMYIKKMKYGEFYTIDKDEF